MNKSCLLCGNTYHSTNADRIYCSVTCRKANYYKNNREKCIRSAKRYEENNLEKTRQYHVKYRRDNKQKLKDYNLKRNYGLTLDQYNKMSQDQNDRCAICSVRTKLYVDHCHKTNKVRGLLCNRCNRSIGQFEDSPKILLAAITYLRETA